MRFSISLVAKRLELLLRLLKITGNITYTLGNVLEVSHLALRG
jgi:hypothetical protein